ncbi:MAG: hypothetical protein AAGB12_02235 [Pseudomonadota bacterium]
MFFVFTAGCVSSVSVVVTATYSQDAPREGITLASHGLASFPSGVCLSTVVTSVVLVRWLDTALQRGETVWPVCLLGFVYPQL